MPFGLGGALKDIGNSVVNDAKNQATNMAAGAANNAAGAASGAANNALDGLAGRALGVSPVPPPPMSRRVPLSNIQNQALSPYSINTTIPAKRPAKPSRDVLGPPPAKKTHLDDGYHGLDQKENRLATPSKIRLVPKTPSRHDTVHQRRDAPPSRGGGIRAKILPVPSRRPGESQLKNKRRPSVQQKAPKDKQAAAIAENNEQIKAWQRHYLKVFPHLIFYLDDSVSEDTRAMLRIHLHELDSSVVDSFSTDIVTHVITGRDDIPAEFPKDRTAGGSGTINPKLLGSGTSLKDSSKERSTGKLDVFEDHKDILVTARLHSMKIWTTEKLKRMINTLNEPIEDYAPAPVKMLPSKLKKIEMPKFSNRKPTAEELKREAEALDWLLRQDNRCPPSLTTSSKEMYMFKGPYIMVGDASGRYRPFIVREFASVKEPEDGDWPQFRSNREGRCPFILDADTKRAYQREEAGRVAEAKTKHKEAPRAKTKPVMDPPPREQSLKTKLALSKDDSTTRTILERKPLRSIENKADRDLATAAAATAIRKTEGRLDKLRETQRIRQDSLVITGYEPNASGLRPTGPTSAVVSQAISSNTAVAGPKAGTSRDVHRLNRRVFEKTTGGIRQTNTTASLQVADEDAHEVKTERKSLKRARSEMIVKEARKQPVPGYCENCRDKYDDFEEHIVSKRHVKFASNDNNFTELDALLSTLKRPHKTSLSRTPSY
ncbi:hypothetical protein Dda_1185 [Drechslerella dactyloides]|uniref:DBF4-type domain-containing protein n=1 Tax=Drechslerella dactyloides TaxID=74499 RepID=A0AAD6NNY1_DREDA|nr:hypothetical protein Dda_1185 [Drechslerella dactyloides]